MSHNCAFADVTPWRHLRSFALLLAIFPTLVRSVAVAQGASTETTNPDTPPTPTDLLHAWETYLSRFGETVCEFTGEDFIGASLDALKKDDRIHEVVTSRSLSEGSAYVRAFISPKTNQVASTEVRATNRNYAFSLMQQENGSVELWELDAESPSEELENKFLGAKLARSWVNGPFCTLDLDMTLLQVFRHKSFRLTNITDNTDGNWRIEFDCEVPGELGRVFYGPVALVVQREGYRLPISLAARVRTPLCDSKVFINMEYADALGLPRLSRFRSAVEKLCGKEKSAGEGSAYITWRRPTDEDRKTLYLSHYGLPEPKKPGRINWWIMLGGALLLAGIYRLISRRGQ